LETDEAILLGSKSGGGIPKGYRSTSDWYLPNGTVSATTPATNPDIAIKRSILIEAIPSTASQPMKIDFALRQSCTGTPHGSRSIAM